MPTTTTKKRLLTVKREQFRQAKSIHGGLPNLFVAALGISLSRVPIPVRRLRPQLYRGIFGKKYPPGLDETEAEMPLSAYRSINALFTRGVKPEYRPIPAGTPQFLCPCDGTVQDIGRVAPGRALTLKGIGYTLDSLVPGTNVRLFEGGHFAVIFLSPIDCHRVFSPQDALLEEVTHVPGHRLLVHPPFQRAEFPVYTLNERMVFRLSTALGPCLVVMVAGWGVGNIRLPMAPEFRPRSSEAASKTWSPPITMTRGQWLATFELGSTVVLLTPRAGDVASEVGSNEKVRYGQPLFTYGS
jgi:phosphatidylserine decarboxylase